MLNVIGLLISALLAAHAQPRDTQVEMKRLVATDRPREEYRGSLEAGDGHMWHVLNQWLLRRSDFTWAPCDGFALEELHALEARLNGLRNQTHNEVYERKGDKRRMTLLSNEELFEMHREKADIISDIGEDSEDFFKRKSCTSIINLFVHHLSPSQQDRLKHTPLPLLPDPSEHLSPHSPTRRMLFASWSWVTKEECERLLQSSCANCHSPTDEMPNCDPDHMLSDGTSVAMHVHSTSMQSRRRLASFLMKHMDQGWS